LDEIVRKGNGMKTQAIHKLLDLAKRLPSIEILDAGEITPLLEAARAIKAAEGELEAACDCELENERFECLLQGRRPERRRTSQTARTSLSLSF
jgi:hypothetical protein